MMGGGWSRWCLSLVMVAACSRENPLYDLGAMGSASGGMTSAASDPTEGTAMTATADESTGLTLDTSAQTSTGIGECTAGFRPPIGFSSSPQLQLPNCVDPVTFGVSNEELMPGGGLAVRLCESCPCAPGEGVPHVFTTEFPIPPLPNCYELTVQPLPRGDLSCDLGAYSIATDDGLVLVVSNVVDPTLDEPFDFELAREPYDGCDAGCAWLSGPDTLLTTDGDPVRPDEEPTIIVTDVRNYQVWNLGSGLDDECKSVGRWHALITGGSG